MQGVPKRVASVKCADPVLCYTDQKGKRIFRHFSLATKIFKEHLHDQVFDCGKCLFCRKKKATELAVRCVLHSSLYEDNCFLTLTYDEKRKGYSNVYSLDDIQKFKKKFRNLFRVFYSDISSRKKRCYYYKKVEIFDVHEYGEKGKKHWHLVVFNHSFNDRRLLKLRKGIPLYTSNTLRSVWSHGHVSVGDVSEGSAMYQAQYMEKDFKNRYAGTSKKSKSQHRGIGKPYFLRHYRQILSLGYVTCGGRRLPVPRTFEKIAHKHWSHFNCKSNFIDTFVRKALYRPFRPGEANEEISNLYRIYKSRKDSLLPELEAEWREVILQHLTSGERPDFIKSAENALHDLRLKNKEERF